MRRIRGVLPFLALLALPAGVRAETDKPTGSYPRIANYYLRKTILDVHKLAKWDLVIVSTGATRAQLDSLRALNPDIRILAYVVSNGVATSIASKCYDPSLRVECEYYQACDAANWWLYSADGTHAADWPGKWDVNVTSFCPTNGSGKKYRDWFPDFVVDRVLNYDPGKYDGVFLDNCWELISFLNAVIPSPIDLNRDGIPEASDPLNTAWTDGMTSIVDDIRARVGSQYIVMGNGPNRFYDDANGTMIEGFPFNGPPDPGCPYGYAWTKWMWTSNYSYFNNLSGFGGSPAPSNVINSFWGTGTDLAPNRTADYERYKRFMLGSTLLGDGYFSLDYNGSTHRSLWWEPEYELPLGTPLGPARRDTVPVFPGGPNAVLWVRDFTNGKVVVNPTLYQFTPDATVGFLRDWDAAIVASPPRPVGTIQLDSYSASGASFHWMHPYAGEESPLEAFEVRVGSAPITNDASWNAATPYAEVTDPGTGSLNVTGGLPALDLQGTYYVALRSRDRADRRSTISPNLVLSQVVGVLTPSVAPRAPHGLSGVRKGDEIRLAWSAPGEAGVHAWRVYGETAEGAFAPRPGGVVRAPEFRETVSGPAARAYRVTALDADGRESAPSATIRVEARVTPILLAWPNPFRDRVALRASGPTENGAVRIFDVLGRAVRTLEAPAGPDGSREWSWDGRDDRGRSLSSGTYWARLAAGSGSTSIRLLLLRE